MPRKVFISFLGTNNYVLCKYNINGKVSRPVRFVQEALIEHLCNDWSAEDRIFIFCTSQESTGEIGSSEINWLDNGQAKISDESEKIGLQHCLKELNMQALVEKIDIKAGFSEDEIWDIFNTVYSQLLPGDEIYFDVTHAFRSIPLFSIVLFNYSRFMKRTRLASILYGAFEKLGPAYKVKDLPIEERVAPVIDLTNIARLQEYNQIAGGLKDFGKAKKLTAAIAGRKNTSTDQAVAQLRNAISELDEFIATIDLKEIKKGAFVSKFRNNYKSVKKRQEIVVPIMNILDELYKETEDFVCADDYRNIEAAINWTIKHDMLMQAYPLAEEYIILRVHDQFLDLKPSGLSSKEFRQFVSSILGMNQTDFVHKNWKYDAARFPEVANELANDDLVKGLRPIYNPIRESRNSLAHGNGAIKYKELKKGIPRILKGIQYINPDYEQYPSTQYIINNLCSKI